MFCFLLDSARGWAQPEVIAQVALAIFTLATLGYFLWSFRKTLEDTYYASLDSMYFDLLKIAMERPYLMEPATLPADKEGEYDAYAFMIWNFIETIFDRCGKNKTLCATWYPVVDTENARHREWFYRPVNRGKFKESFKDFIEQRYRTSQVGPRAAGEARKDDASLTAKSGQQGA